MARSRCRLRKAYATGKTARSGRCLVSCWHGLDGSDLPVPGFYLEEIRLVTTAMMIGETSSVGRAWFLRAPVSASVTKLDPRCDEEGFFIFARACLLRRR